MCVCVALTMRIEIDCASLAVANLNFIHSHPLLPVLYYRIRTTNFHSYFIHRVAATGWLQINNASLFSWNSCQAWILQSHSQLLFYTVYIYIYASCNSDEYLIKITAQCANNVLREAANMRMTFIERVIYLEKLNMERRLTSLRFAVKFVILLDKSGLV